MGLVVPTQGNPATTQRAHDVRFNRLPHDHNRRTGADTQDLRVS